MTLRGLIQRPWQVRGFLAGRRTQVRVRVNIPPGDLEPTEIWRAPGGRFIGTWDLDPIDHNDHDGLPYSEHFELRCPLGAPGTVLAIRETWSPSFDPYHGGFLHYREGFGTEDAPVVRAPQESLYWPGWDKAGSRVEWRSPATMPLWAARLRYRVLDIRAHLVREISEEDAEAEGMEFHDGDGVGHSGWRHERDHGYVYGTARDAFAVAWNEQYGPGYFDRDWCFAATVQKVDGGEP